MFRRQKIRTPRLRQQRRQQRLNAVVLGLALVGALVLLLSQLSMVPAISVERIIVQGNKVLTGEEIVGVAERAMRGHYVNLFSKQNVFLYSRADIEHTLLEEYPRVKEVDIDFDTFSQIVVQIVERETSALYCSSARSDACFAVDDGGFIFAPAASFSRPPHFVYTTRVGTGTTALGDSVLLPLELVEFEPFKEAVTDVLPQEPRMLSIGEVGEYRMGLEGGADVVFDPADGYETLLQNLHSIVASDVFVQEAGEHLERLDYIDLRFGNKVFYKLRDV